MMNTALLYEANAGTGKTRTLTNHILSAVNNGMSLERICALTFTDKAANEMLDRLRSRVAELISAGTLDPVQMQLAGKCFMGTIHAFCLQLLKRYAPELSLPPIFEIDPQEEKFDALFENRWDEFLSRLLLSQQTADQEIIQSLGVTTLRIMAEQLVKTRYKFQLQSDDVQWLAEDLSNARKWNYRKGSWGEFVTKLVKDYEAHRDVLSAMVQTYRVKAPYHPRLKDLLSCKSKDLYRAVALVTQRFVKPFLEEYHASGYVTYDDLLRFAHELLKVSRIRSEVKNRYDLVLVDEMQDTDAMQYEIIFSICERKDRHNEIRLRDLFLSGGRVELEPGKLFAVGDPKQSIYGFRNADLSAYDSMKIVLQNSGAEIRPLDQNFRSCPNLVEFSNELAVHLFPGMKPHDSNAARGDLCEGTSMNDCVHLVKILSPDKDRLHLRILSEANWIAKTIRERVDSGKAKFQDFGVLLRKLVHSHLYVDALSACDIPVIIEGERFFYKSQEVIDFVNLLKFIVDEKDDVALAGTLRSPLFGIADRDIALFFHAYHAKERSLMEAFAATTSAETSILLLNQIYEIRKQVHLLSPAGLVDLVLKKLPVLSVAALAYGTFRSTLAPLNVLRIHKFAVELENDPANNLFHFVSMLTEFSRSGKERPQEPLADEGLDAVRMMSIHNSKGLDFPIVFVPLTDYEIRSAGYRPTEIIHNWASDVSGLKINNITEANYLKLKYTEAPDLDDEIGMETEEKRVLYVAATRAKKEIFFCCLENGGGKEILQLLKNKFPFVELKEVASNSALEQTTGRPAEYQPFAPLLERWTQVREASQKTGLVLDSVTAEAERLEPGQEELAIIAARAKRSGGTLVGLLCHGALEKWDFAKTDPSKRSAELHQLLQVETGKYSRNFSKRQINHAAEESRRILGSFLDSPAARWLSEVDVVGRELPIVSFDVAAGKILSGKIDLLVKEQDRYCIIDYKTDHEISETMLRRYTQQMRMYAATLEESLSANSNSISRKLILVRNGEVIEV